MIDLIGLVLKIIWSAFAFLTLIGAIPVSEISLILSCCLLIVLFGAN